MAYSPEEYSKWYIIQALFKLINQYEFEKISITDIANKAGVGRATFYRYFKRKEDVIVYYFEHNTKEFIFNQRFFPRCKEDYIKIVQNVLSSFKEQREPLKLICKAHLEYIYLDYLNTQFSATFESDYPTLHKYTPYLYAGLLFNVSMRWLEDDCLEPVDTLANLIVNAIYAE